MSDSDEIRDVTSPVEADEGDEAAGAGPGQVREGIALCLSGGGYRAMLFHVGSLWRLNELGYLPKLDRISSVSGGSITSAFLGLRWNSLGFQNDVSPLFEQNVAEPIRGMAR